MPTNTLHLSDYLIIIRVLDIILAGSQKFPMAKLLQVWLENLVNFSKKFYSPQGF